MNKKIICFVGIGIASLCALIGALLLFQNIEKRSGDELCRIGLRHMETGDNVEAVRYWRKAADKGDVLALRLLAKCYENGNGGVEQDLTKAAELYCKAAARRNGDSEWYKNKKYELGYRYTKGLGVNQDGEKAFFWLCKAAREGDLGGLFAVGLFYELGEVVPKNEAEAIKYYRMAADREFRPAKEALKRLGLSSE
jgi:TPR repeat protein